MCDSIRPPSGSQLTAAMQRLRATFEHTVRGLEDRVKQTPPAQRPAAERAAKLHAEAAQQVLRISKAPTQKYLIALCECCSIHQSQMSDFRIFIFCVQYIMTQKTFLARVFVAQFLSITSSLARIGTSCSGLHAAEQAA